jgi:hypothetical protein
MATTIEYAELGNCDTSQFRTIALADDRGSSYVPLWKAPGPLGKMYASDVAAQTLSSDSDLLIINVQDVDDVATRCAICDELRALLAGRHGNAQEAWEGPLP